MGRRKIEIQPINHERNRSVTFLKRKNGLFKKAYELGVLCSVDVAVIIFESRPGHHVKLYQYCSTDIHDVVQRHIRYDGEKDTRSPIDFSGNAGSKLDDVGEVDDDDADDDGPADTIPSRSGPVKRRGDGKSGGKPGDSMSIDVDYPLRHASMTIPPPPMPLLHPSQLSSTSSLPISGERNVRGSGAPQLHPASASNKKPRITSNTSTHGRASPDEHNGYSYHSPTSATVPSFRQPQNPQYPFSFPVATPPPTNFIAGGFDFSATSGRNAPARSSGFSQRGPPYADQNQQGMYQITRQQYQQQQSNSQSQPPSATPDLFAAFLDADQHRQTQGQGSYPSSLDWPVHGEAPPTAANPPGPQDPNWLDFLSGNNVNAPALPAGAGREAMSWEREHRDVPDMFGSGGGGGERSAGTSPLVKHASAGKHGRARSGSGHDEEGDGVKKETSAGNLKRKSDDAGEKNGTGQSDGGSDRG